jgi:hypothetical protein
VSQRDHQGVITPSDCEVSSISPEWLRIGQLLGQIQSRGNLSGSEVRDLLHTERSGQDIHYPGGGEPESEASEVFESCTQGLDMLGDLLNRQGMGDFWGPIHPEYASTGLEMSQAAWNGHGNPGAYLSPPYPEVETANANRYRIDPFGICVDGLTSLTLGDASHSLPVTQQGWPILMPQVMEDGDFQMGGANAYFVPVTDGSWTETQIPDETVPYMCGNEA